MVELIYTPTNSVKVFLFLHILSSICCLQIFFYPNIFYFAFFKIYILLHFRFWGTCAKHAGLLHRYLHGNVVCCLHPHHLYLAFLPMLSFPNSLPFTVPPLAPFSKPQCVMLPSLCPCVLIVQHLTMSENMWYLIFCSCVSLLRGSSMSLQRTQTHHFLWLHSIPWCICATFSLSSLSSVGISVSSRSLLLQTMPL